MWVVVEYQGLTFFPYPLQFLCLFLLKVSGWALQNRTPSFQDCTSSSYSYFSSGSFACTLTWGQWYTRTEVCGSPERATLNSSASCGARIWYRAGNTVLQRKRGFWKVNCLPTDLSNTAPELMADWQALSSDLTKKRKKKVEVICTSCH